MDFLNLALLMSSGELMESTPFVLLESVNLCLGMHCTSSDDGSRAIF